MSSYIKLIFKYLFEPETLPAELLAAGNGPLQQELSSSSTGKVDVVFVVNSAGQQRGPGEVGLTSSRPLVGIDESQRSSQLPVNYSSSSSSSSSSSDNMTRPHEASGLFWPSHGPIMVNKSLVDAAVASTHRLVSASTGWLQQQQQQQQQQQTGGQQLQSADSSGGANSKLWPPNCLSFARMFAMAQQQQQQHQSGQAPHNNAGVANGTTTTITPTATTMVASNYNNNNNNDSDAGLLSARLGSFAEFEHLIRQQLAAVAKGIGNFTPSSSSLSSGPTSTPPSAALTAPSTTLSGFLSGGGHGHSDGNSQSGITSAAFYTAGLAASGQQQQHASNPLRLLIGSIGHAAAGPIGTRHDNQIDQVNFQFGQQTNAGAGDGDGVPVFSYAHHTHREPLPQAGPIQVQVNSLELLECYNQLQLNDYYQGYDIFIGLRIASTLSILFIIFILFVIYKTNCHNGERTSRSQLRLTSNADKLSHSPLSSAGSTQSLVNKQRPGRTKSRERTTTTTRNDEKYQKKSKRTKRDEKKKKINLTCAGEKETPSSLTEACARQCEPRIAGTTIADNSAHDNTCGSMQARTNNDDDHNNLNRGPQSWTSMPMNDEIHVKHLPSECPSVMVVIEDDSSA